MQSYALITQHLGKDWADWIESNFARGCFASDMQRDMVAAGVDEQIARLCLEAVSGEADSALTGWDPLPSAQLPDGLPEAARLCFRVSSPRIAVIDDFLSAQECQALIDASATKLQRSSVVDQQDGSFSVDAARTSEGTHFQRGASTLIQTLEARIACLMQWPVENGEGFQVLHYCQKGEYRAHYDYFDPAHPGSAQQLKHGGQRVGTVILYLQDVAEGGGTSFPNLGLSVNARRGRALIFANVSAGGQLLQQSLHAGDPVLGGDKWIATKWLRAEENI